MRPADDAVEILNRTVRVFSHASHRCTENAANKRAQRLVYTQLTVSYSSARVLLCALMGHFGTADGFDLTPTDVPLYSKRGTMQEMWYRNAARGSTLVPELSCRIHAVDPPNLRRIVSRRTPQMSCQEANIDATGSWDASERPV